MRRFCLLTALLALIPSVQADVKLPAVLGSNMVLQREKPVKLWGWANPGEEIAIEFGGKSTKTSAGNDGIWKAELPAFDASADPRTMTIAGKNKIELTNILVGEVWLGSGQSNMQWGVISSANAEEEIKNAKHPNIRLFGVPLVPNGEPAKDVNSQWQECSPESIPYFSAVLYFFGRELHQELDVPIGLVNSSWGGTRIEPWIPPEGYQAIPELKLQLEDFKSIQMSFVGAQIMYGESLKRWGMEAQMRLSKGQLAGTPPAPPVHPFNNNFAYTGLYNGMIHPVAPFSIRGALWYQGESNRGKGMEYHQLMKGLIAGWRKVWDDPEMPFYFVQLAPFNYGNNPEALAEIWEAQAATLAVPNTGMAVTTDITDINDIHPLNKQDVGKRLSRWALAKQYGKKDLVYSGPLYQGFEIEGNKIRVKFSHAAGLKARDGKALTWFTIAGADNKFVEAQATIDGESVLVHAEGVKAPAAVRFSWNHIAEPNLSNGADLPASPFRTDGPVSAFNEGTK